MQIVSQSASISYPFFPSYPLLSAPPPRKQICAPRIAGLLPAKTAMPQVEIVIEKPLSIAELLRQLGPLRTLEEMNQEILDLWNSFGPSRGSSQEERRS